MNEYVVAASAALARGRRVELQPFALAWGTPPRFALSIYDDAGYLERSCSVDDVAAWSLQREGARLEVQVAQTVETHRAELSALLARAQRARISLEATRASTAELIEIARQHRERTQRLIGAITGVLAPVAPAAAPAPGFRLLLVDDEPLVRRMMSRLFRRLGVEVHEADGVASALAAVAQLGVDRLDVVVTERRFGDGSGHDLLARLRAARPALPVVMFTSEVDPGREPVPDAYVVKPARFDILHACCLALVQRADRADQGAPSA